MSAHADVALLTLAALVTLTAVHRWQVARADARDLAVTSVRAITSPVVFARDSVAAQVDRAIVRSPFRPEPYSPEPVATAGLEAEYAPPALSTPDVTVLAIVGGPPWQGVLRGVPGVGGDLVVRPEDRYGDLRVISVAADGILLRWNDTTWTIRLPGVIR